MRTLGQLLIDEALPADMRGRGGILDKKGVKQLLQEVADKYPDKYREVSKALSDVGLDATFTTGSYSFGLNALRQSIAAKKMQYELGGQLRKIYTNPSLTSERRKAEILKAVGKYQKTLTDDVLAESESENNPLAGQIRSGSRGNKFNLNSLRGADLFYTDHRGTVIPVPVLHSYSQGLRPHEYFVGAFGTRKGIFDLKQATADAGFLAKQLTQASHRLLVTGKDDDTPYDQATPRGYPVETLDEDNEGALLAHPVGGYPRNTQLTPKILKELHSKGHKNILVRSPMVGGPGDGGVYGRDAGVRERGGISPVGDYIGISAAAALSEPVTQSQICLDSETLVRMGDFTVKKIRDIEPGEKVMGATTAGVCFAATVIRRYDNGARQCYRTVFQKAYQKTSESEVEIVSTLQHKILAVRRTSNQKADKYSKLARLYPVGQPGKHFGAVPPTGCDNTELQSVEEPLAALVGALIGDGCYTRTVNGCYFKCHDHTFVSHLRDTLADVDNLKITQLRHHRGTYYRISQVTQSATRQAADTGRFVGTYRNPIMRWLDDREMLHKYAHEKSLPPDIDSWSNRSVAALLGGLFAADGSVYSPKRCQHWRIAFGVTSRLLVDQVERLLSLRFGVYGSRSVNTYGGRKRPVFYLHIAHPVCRLRFLNSIPLFGVKRGRIVELNEEYPISAIHQHYQFIRRSQVCVGERFTCDLEVDHPDHLFVLANGLIVSNSSKHSGGIAKGSAGGISGFQYINQLVQIPKTFKGGAAHSQLDGTVTAIEKAPQGGHYVTVGNEKHYVGQGFALKVKRGDKVEAGDVLSEGTPNPSEVVKHKGVGEGRRYFVQAFRKALTDSGTYGNRRNIELLSRGLINHVRLTDEIDDWVPDDVVPYQLLERKWRPRPGHVVSNPKQAIGKYLERPVLHYTIGTKIRPSMLTELDKYGVKNVFTHADPPPFQPEMVRGMANIAHDPDWMTRMLGSYQQKSLLGGVYRGDTSDTEGSSYVPALATGGDFGRKGLTKGWQ